MTAVIGIIKMSYSLCTIFSYGVSHRKLGDVALDFDG